MFPLADENSGGCSGDDCGTACSMPGASPNPKPAPEQPVHPLSNALSACCALEGEIVL